MFNSECYDVVNYSVVFFLALGIALVVLGIGGALIVEKIRGPREAGKEERLGILGGMVMAGLLCIVPLIISIIIVYAYPAHSLYWLFNGGNSIGLVEVNGHVHEVPPGEWMCVPERGYEDSDRVRAAVGGSELLTQDVERGKYVVKLSPEWSVEVKTQSYGTAEFQQLNASAARATGFDPFGPRKHDLGIGLHRVAGEDDPVYGIEDELPNTMSKSSGEVVVASKILLKK